LGLESGPTSAWLFRALTAAGLPTVCLDARHAQAARANKSDPSDARGLAAMVRVGWFRAAKVKSTTSHERKALLISRHQSVEIRVRTDNQLREILKTFGLIIGTCGRGHISRRARELVADRPELQSLVDAMLATRETVVAQIAELDRMVRRLVKDDDTIRRTMTVPGVGPVVALAFQSVVDDPGRSGRATGVPPRRASGANA
jgi:transposase